jgi:hypothetical protein
MVMGTRLPWPQGTLDRASENESPPERRYARTGLVSRIGKPIAESTYWDDEGRGAGATGAAGGVEGTGARVL